MEVIDIVDINAHGLRVRFHGIRRMTTSTPFGHAISSEIIAVARNRLLGALPPEELDALAPHMAETRCEPGTVLQEAGQPFRRIHFPVSGLISLVGMLPDGHEIDTVTIGREGAVGLMAALGSPVAWNRAIVQMPGHILSVPPGRLAELADRSRALRALIARYHDVLTAQVQQTAVCNSVHPIQARLCRWLLQARDRTANDKLALTQEFLSGILGVQRTTITLVSRILQTEGILQVRRGHIQIRDAEGLERKACGCYRVIRRLIDQIGRDPARPLMPPPTRNGILTDLQGQGTHR